jgi:hypothetical protein
MNENEIDQLMIDYYKSKNRHEYWYGLLTAFKQWAKYEDNYSIKLYERILYTIKAIICMILNRRKDYWAKDCICVAIFDHRHIGNGGGADVPSWYADWNEMVVGEGLFKNWSYDIYSNANA